MGPIGDSVEHEINRLDLIGSFEMGQWLPVCNRDFLSLTTSDLQALFDIQPRHAFVIDVPLGLSQFQMNHESSALRLI